MKKVPSVGSRAQVYHGTAIATAGGLHASDLFKDKYGRIRSRAASRAAKRRFQRNPELRDAFKEHRIRKESQRGAQRRATSARTRRG